VGSDFGDTDNDLESKIEIRDGEMGWQHVPSWLGFFFRLGENVASSHENGHRVAVVLVPPVRCFAAATAAAAAVVRVASSAEAVPTVDEHFDLLAQLAPSTAVVVKMGERIYSGTLAGVNEHGPHAGLTVAYSGMSHFIPKHLCQRVQAGSGGRKTLPRGSTRTNRTEADAITAIVGARVASGFLSVPTVDVVLIGNINLLTQELANISVRAASDLASGGVPLGNLLRSARFLPEGGISRSMLASDRLTEFQMPVSDTPHVAVFDGVRAFARYRHEFKHSSWIVIFDRCSPGLTEGADIANEEFATRTADANLTERLAVPDGTEIQVFAHR
jgi:hypothetical protein